MPRRATASPPPAGRSEERLAPPGRRERAKQEKRARLLQAARELFADRGFDATTTAAVAARADIGTGTLFLYVQSKEELLVLVFLEDMDRVCDAAFASLPRRAGLLDEIAHVFDSMMAFHARDRAMGRLYAKEMAFVRAPNRAGVVAFMERLLARCDARVAAAQARGEIAADVSVRVLSENLFAIYFLHLQNGLGDDADLTAPARRAALRAALALQLRGLGASPAVPTPPARRAGRGPSRGAA